MVVRGVRGVKGRERVDRSSRGCCTEGDYFFSRGLVGETEGE